MGANRVWARARRWVLAAALSVALVVAAVGPAAAEGPDRTFTYRVEARGEIRTDLRTFAREAGAILADARGWTLGGSIAFREVRSRGDFTLVLASPDAVARASSACSALYSCRVGDQVLINERNWRETTPPWRRDGGDLRTYRPYLINHEVGHRLGFGHRNCGGAGSPAPVMQQQSKGLQGCQPSGWPSSSERRDLGARYGVPVHPWVFTDVLHGRVHTDAIHRAARAGIVAGRPDGSFRPGDRVTRAQLASFLARALGLPQRGTPPFPDVSPDDPHAGAIAALAEAGVVTGDRDGLYHPTQGVTRGQMATMLARAYELRAQGPPPFRDVDADDAHAPGIEAVARRGIAVGYGDGTFRPREKVTRAQMASFLVRADPAL